MYRTRPTGRIRYMINWLFSRSNRRQFQETTVKLTGNPPTAAGGKKEPIVTTRGFRVSFTDKIVCGRLKRLDLTCIEYDLPGVFNT